MDVEHIELPLHTEEHLSRTLAVLLTESRTPVL